MDVTAALNSIISSPTLGTQEEYKKELAAYLNHLLVNDFPALVQILYRVDVSEKNLKVALKENPQADAGGLLAELLIKRQREKVAARQNFSSTTFSADEEPGN